MSALAEIRQEVADALKAADLTAYAYVPESVTPPVAVVVADYPYVERGESFCAWTVRLQVLVIVPALNNQTAADALDDIVSTTVSTLSAVEGIEVNEVGEPAGVNLAGKTFVGAYISITVPTNQV